MLLVRHHCPSVSLVEPSQTLLNRQMSVRRIHQVGILSVPHCPLSLSLFLSLFSLSAYRQQQVAPFSKRFIL